jgi:hypothetical protein
MKRKQLNEKDDIISYLILGAIFGSFLTLLMLSLFYKVTADKADVINTREYGNIMCSNYGLEYDHRDLLSVNTLSGSEATVPKIYCKEKDNLHEQKLIDSIVVLKV